MLPLGSCLQCKEKAPFMLDSATHACILHAPASAAALSLGHLLCVPTNSPLGLHTSCHCASILCLSPSPAPAYFGSTQPSLPVTQLVRRTPCTVTWGLSPQGTPFGVACHIMGWAREEYNSRARLRSLPAGLPWTEEWTVELCGRTSEGPLSSCSLLEDDDLSASAC